MQMIEAYRLHDGMWLQIAMHQESERARIEPFDAIELDLAALWGDFKPPTHAAENSPVWRNW